MNILAGVPRWIFSMVRPTRDLRRGTGTKWSSLLPKFGGWDMLGTIPACAGVVGPEHSVLLSFCPQMRWSCRGEGTLAYLIENRTTSVTPTESGQKKSWLWSPGPTPVISSPLRVAHAAVCPVLVERSEMTMPDMFNCIFSCSCQSPLASSSSTTAPVCGPMVCASRCTTSSAACPRTFWPPTTTILRCVLSSSPCMHNPWARVCGVSPAARAQLRIPCQHWLVLRRCRGGNHPQWWRESDMWADMQTWGCRFLITISRVSVCIYLWSQLFIHKSISIFEMQAHPKSMLTYVDVFSTVVYCLSPFLCSFFGVLWIRVCVWLCIFM